MRRLLAIPLLLLATVAMAQNPSTTADPPGGSIKEVPTTDITRSLDSLNYDNPNANPDNRAPLPVCNADQLEVKIGSDSASNGQHGIPVSFSNGSSDTCTLGPGVEVKLENSSKGMGRVREGNSWVTKEITRYKPIPLQSCQNCGSFHFGGGPGQDIRIAPGTVVYLIIGYTSLSSVPCSSADTFTWSTQPGAEPQHIPATFNVCAPLRFSGILKQLPDGFVAP